MLSNLLKFSVSSLFLLFIVTTSFSVFSSQDVSKIDSFSLNKGLEIFQKFKTQYFPSNMKNLKYFNYFDRIPYTKMQIDDFKDELKRNLYGNPHSESSSSERANNVIENMRRDILKLFNTNISKYTVVYSHSPMQGLKLILEAFPFGKDSHFMYSTTTSEDFLGYRALAKEKGAKLNRIDVEKDVTEETFSDIEMYSNNIVFVPLVDMFSGVKLGDKQLENILKAQEFGNKTIVIADGTFYKPIDLAKYPLDAVSFSLEKAVGFPPVTFVVIENSLIRMLERPYFGGGTLVYALTKYPFEKLRLRPSHRLEDGSLPFLSLVSAQQSLNLYKNIGPSLMEKHISRMAKLFELKLSELTYSTGSKMVSVYGKHDRVAVSFNIKDQRGGVISYIKTQAEFKKAGYVLGSGCHKTPGSCYSYLGISEGASVDDIKNNKDIGALQASFGVATTEADVTELVRFINKTYYR